LISLHHSRDLSPRKEGFPNSAVSVARGLNVIERDHWQPLAELTMGIMRRRSKILATLERETANLLIYFFFFNSKGSTCDGLFVLYFTHEIFQIGYRHHIQEKVKLLLLCVVNVEESRV